MKVWSTSSTRLRRSASSTSWRACSEVSVIGFSSQTCLPARSAAIASSKCVWTGVAMATASIGGIGEQVAGGRSVVVTPG